ncbi:hypothetical protein FcAc13_06105 [Frischella sp. Ac13]|uniref:Uncharacterized protein n=1 Tax=Frischella japonica TaxID=2741544 RepID=A0ABR7QXD2_9GAMM|nr:hypothetical protein [Frischella japonica]MBC9130881.1 hypothetical protein [Frischella japonica]
MHKLLLEADIPWQGSKFTGNLDDFMKVAKEAYKDIDAKGVLKFQGKNGRIVQKNLTPLEALEEIEKKIKSKNIPCK